MINLRQYLQDKIDIVNASYNDNTGTSYKFKVYDEFSYTFVDEEKVGVPMILSCGAIEQTDTKRIYQLSFVLNFRGEKNGFDKTIDVLNNFWLEYNNDEFTADGYNARIVMQSPIVLNALNGYEDGYYTGGCIRGDLFFSKENELEIGHTFYLNGEQIKPNGLSITNKPNYTTLQVNGVGQSKVSYRTRQITFTLWVDNSTIVNSILTTIYNDQEQSYTFIEKNATGTNLCIFENLSIDAELTYDIESGREIIRVGLVQ